MSSLDNNNFEKIFKEAKLNFDNEEFDKVIDLLKGIIDKIINSDILVIYYKSLRIIDEKNNKAINYLLKALDIDKDNIDILYEILTYYSKNRKSKNFINYFNKLLNINSNEDIHLLMIKNKDIINNRAKINYLFRNNNKTPLKSLLNKYLILEKLGILDNYLSYQDKTEFWDFFFITRKLKLSEINKLLLFSVKVNNEDSYQEGILIQNYIEALIKKKSLEFRVFKENLISSVDFEVSFKNYKKLLRGNLRNENKIILLIKILSLYNYVSSSYNNEYIKLINNLSKTLKEKNKFNTFNNKENKKIKIGYFSQDFNEHPIQYFLLFLYKNHNKDKFEIYSYYIDNIFDEITNEFKNYSDYWRNLYDFKNEKIADIIHKDKIDILIDLAGFTDKTRITALSYKPAPVQLSMIGYHDTIAIDTMDYKILDSYLSKNIDKYFLEKIINMQDSLFCYQAPNKLPKINKLPFIKNKYLTFGSFSNGLKITKNNIEFWAKVLFKYKNSKLLIKCNQVYFNFFREKILNSFLEYNILSKRVEFYNIKEKTIEHLELYNTIDISLDTYPYNGVTTTFESLIMGIPVLTLTGNTVASRAGKSILKNLGLDNWIIEDLDKEINIDLDNLEYLRKNLRKKLLSSVLCDHKGFTLKLENIYQEILRR